MLKAGLEASVATLLYERGIQTKEDLEDFLRANWEATRPYLLHDMESGGAHPTGHWCMNGLICGDYDADRMASACMKETLEQMGQRCKSYSPTASERLWSQ